MDKKRFVHKLLLVLIPLLIGSYWVFYKDLSSIIDKATNSECEYFSSFPTYDVAVSTNGEVWVVTNDALLAFDGNFWQEHIPPYNYPDTLGLSSIQFDQEGRLWLLNDNAISVYDGIDWVFYTEEDWGLPRTSPTSITFDQNGRAWVGLSRTGISKENDPGGGIALFDGKNWQLFPTVFGMTTTYDDIKIIKFDPQGKLWLGIYSGPLVVLEFLPNTELNAGRIDENGIKAELHPLDLLQFYIHHFTIYDMGEVYAIDFDAKGQAWINIGGSLYRFNEQGSKIMNTSGKGGVEIDQKGNIWFGSEVYDGKRWRTYNSLSSCLPNKKIYSIAFDHSGTAWVSQFYFPDKVGLTRFAGNPQQMPYITFLLRTILLPRTPAGWIVPAVLAFIWIFIYLEISLGFFETIKIKKLVGQKLDELKLIAIWFSSSIFTSVLGLGIGFAISQFFACHRNLFLELFGSLCWGAITGAFIGNGQAKSLKNSISKPKRLVYANIIAWAAMLFSLELNIPIVKCLASTNAPIYSPDLWSNVYYHFYMTENPVGYYLLISSFLGLFLGLSQGLAQWWALRVDMPKSTIFIVVNIFIWITVFHIGVFHSIQGQSGIIQGVEFLLIAVSMPALATGISISALMKNGIMRK